MLYTLASVFLLAALAKCEPPVQGYHGTQNGYLPPRTGYTAPTNSYLPPTAGYHGGSGGSGGYGGSAGFGGSAGYGGSAGSGGHSGDSHGHSHENEVPKSYEFGYSVKDAQSGNDYGRRESSDGSEVRGEYRVQLPDGRLQIVTYHADWRTGFHADVRYEGEARYPEPQHNTGGYNYNNAEFSGSLTGFHGNAGHGNGNGNGIGVHQPLPAYGPPGYH